MFENLRSLGVVLGPFLRLAPDERENVREVQRTAVGALCDLLPATEAVSHDQRIQRRSSDRRQQPALTDRLRHGVVIALEAKRASHSTTATVDDRVIKAQATKHLLVRMQA